MNLPMKDEVWIGAGGARVTVEGVKRGGEII